MEGELKAKNDEISHLKLMMEEQKINFNETLAKNEASNSRIHSDQQ